MALVEKHFGNRIFCEQSQSIDMPHGFYAATGGVSSGVYASLNCGPGSNDEPSNVFENRRSVAITLSGRRDTPLVTSYQEHGNKCAIVDSDWGNDRPKADAMVTNQPGIILGILTADCTPILFTDNQNQIIGAAHAGWKGALSGVTKSTIDTMISLGAKTENIRAVIGPTIQQPSYEVDINFKTKVTEHSPIDALPFFIEGVDREHAQFDLPGYVEARLTSEGITSIERSVTDTYISERHFSYRRTTHRRESDYGRQVSAIMLASK